MAWLNVATRDGDDPNSFTDFNQLMENIRLLKGGTAGTAPTTTIEDLAGGGGGIGNLKKLTSADSPHTITDADGDGIFLCDTSSGNISLNLPTASDNDGRRINIILVEDTNKVIVVPDGSDTTDETTAFYDIDHIGQNLQLVSDGDNDNWVIMNTAMRKFKSFSPTVTGESGLTVNSSSTLYFDYFVLGKLVYVFFHINVTSTTGSGWIETTLPIDPSGTIFVGDFFTAGGVSNSGTPELSFTIKQTTNSMTFRGYDNGTLSGACRLYGNYVYAID